MKKYNIFYVFAAVLLVTGCSVGTRMQRGNYQAKINHVPRPKIEARKDTAATPQYNAIEITRPDSTKLFLIPNSGNNMPLVTLAEVTVVAKSRSLPERMGKVNLDFIVTIPKELMGNIQSLMVTPYLHKDGKIIPLEDLTIRGGLFSRVQDRNYWQYDRYKEVRKLDQKGAQRVFGRFVSYPYPENVRLDSIADNAHTLSYHYTQEVKTEGTDRGLMKVTLGGKVVALDHSRYEIPISDTLDYVLSSMTHFVDTTTRYMTQIVQKYVTVQDRNCLNFKVNKAEIIDTLADNASQLEKIENLMHEIVNQKEFHVDGITLTASSSPEGSVKHNEALAKGRACSLRDRLAGRFGGEVSKIMTVKWIGEDWQELARLLREAPYSRILWRDKILALIDGSGDMDAVEREIKKRYPGDYAYMLEHLYPQLRAVTFQYDLRRVGMVQDTVHTTVVNRAYMEGVKALTQRRYAAALPALEEYRDINTAIAMLSLGYDQRAWEVLRSLPETAPCAYLKAVACARLGLTAEGLAHYQRACELDGVFKYRGRLDPEISELQQQQGSP